MNRTTSKPTSHHRRARRISLAASGVVIPALIAGAIGAAAPASAAVVKTPPIGVVTATPVGDGQAKVSWHAGSNGPNRTESRVFISVNGGTYNQLNQVASWGFSETGILSGEWGTFSLTTLPNLTPGVPVQFYAQQKATYSNGTDTWDWSSPSYSNVVYPNGVAPLPVNPAPQPLGPVNPTPVAKRAQTAKVALPKKLKRGGQTVILKKTTKTNAGQKVVVKVTGGKLVKGKNGKISIKLPRKPGKKVTITLTAVGNAAFNNWKLIKTYRF